MDSRVFEAQLETTEEFEEESGLTRMTLFQASVESWMTRETAEERKP
jgi:hypothetical protein